MVALLLALLHPVAASDIFELTEVSMEYAQVAGGARIPELPSWSQAKMELNLNVNIRAFKTVYWDNQVHSYVDQSQFRLVGWKFEFGVQVTPWLQIYTKHFSQHVLDAPGEKNFPVYDAIGFRLHFVN